MRSGITGDDPRPESAIRLAPGRPISLTPTIEPATITRPVRPTRSWTQSIVTGADSAATGMLRLLDWCTGHVGRPRMIAVLLLVLAPAAVTLLFAMYGSTALVRYPGGVPAGSTAARIVAAATALGGLCAIYGAGLAILWLRSAAVVQRQRRDLDRLDYTLMRQASDLRDARDHAELLTAMREVSRVVAGGSDFDAVLGDVLRIVDDLAQPIDATIYLDDGDNRLVPRASLTHNESDALRALNGARQAAARHQVIRLVDPARKALTLFIPFEADHAPGVLRIVRELELETAPGEGTLADDAPDVPGPRPLPPDVRVEVDAFERRIVYFIKHVALAVRHLTLYDRATVDGLTRLYNRQTCDRYLHQHTLRADGDGSNLSVIMIDIDHFKSVNDNHGHLSGDLILAGVASVLRHAVRDTDIAFRYGGEEMTVLCPWSDTESTREIAEHLRVCIMATEMRGERGQRIPVTASMGVAQYMPGEGVQAFLSRADAALYQSKEGGRNRVTLAPDPMAEWGDSDLQEAESAAA